MKKSLMFIILFILGLTLTGCLPYYSVPENQSVPENNKNQVATPPVTIVQTGTEITYYLSNEDPLKYCNGADMDSEGFRKTITKKVVVTIPETNLSQIELIRKTIALAQADANLGFGFPQAQENPNYLKLEKGTVYVEPTDGWAGVSIALCNWQPFLEVNLLQIPGVKDVVWVNDLTEWEKIQ